MALSISAISFFPIVPINFTILPLSSVRIWSALTFEVLGSFPARSGKSTSNWVWRSTTLPAGSNLEPPCVSCKEDGIDKFQGLFRRLLEIDRKYWKKAIEMVWKYYPDKRIGMGIISEGDKDLGGRVKKWLGPRK